MCLPKCLSTGIAILVNAALGVWSVGYLDAEYRLISVLFFLPAIGAAGLCCSRRGSSTAKCAGYIMVISGSLKTIGALGFAVLAIGTSDDNNNWVATLGTLISTILAVMLAVSALSDLCAGIPAARARSFQHGTELLPPSSYA